MTLIIFYFFNVRKHEARAKRAMEQRMLRAKQLGEEQKQKLENKEEKSAHLKQKLLAEHQEKNERYFCEYLLITMHHNL